MNSTPRMNDLGETVWLETAHTAPLVNIFSIVSSTRGTLVTRWNNGVISTTVDTPDINNYGDVVYVDIV